MDYSYLLTHLSYSVCGASDAAESPVIFSFEGYSMDPSIGTANLLLFSAAGLSVDEEVNSFAVDDDAVVDDGDAQRTEETFQGRLR